MIEVTQELLAVRREVGSRTLKGGTARTVTITRTYDSGVDDVWDACTNSERIPRWLMPIDGELRLGGRYQLQGNAGGTIESCEPPHGFTATWEFGGKLSWIELRLTAIGDAQTRLELTHIAPDDDHWEQYGPAAVGVGWELGLIGLGIHLSSSDAADPARGAEWATSVDGREFMARSGDAWREADVAAGTPTDHAAEAAARTTEFYAPSKPAQ